MLIKIIVNIIELCHYTINHIITQCQCHCHQLKNYCCTNTLFYSNNCNNFFYLIKIIALSKPTESYTIYISSGYVTWHRLLIHSITIATKFVTTKNRMEVPILLESIHVCVRLQVMRNDKLVFTSNMYIYSPPLSYNQLVKSK